jgi:hypothetical protein
MMHTKDMLAQALREVGLHAMADKAATGYYHDYLSPLDLPEMQLVDDLAFEVHFRTDNPNNEAIKALRQRVINGDFDANKEESDAWAASDEGQEAFRSLMKRR